MSPSPVASTARSADGSKPEMSLNALLQTESFELIRLKADLLARMADDFPGYNGVLHNPIADGDLDGVLRLSGNIVTSLDKIVLLRSQLQTAVPEPVAEPTRRHPRMKRVNVKNKVPPQALRTRELTDLFDQHKAVSSHACHKCDTTDTPKWRAGPHGPHSLCNVCGLLNAKKKKRHMLRWSSRPIES
ncbi:hypothetical protein CP533_2908 [Ophiocordyceps camponoti-saundersi (nom. inval.)]|nr:hypothetical protein CP533_2908 [Ophiocordyceps camponoti-saundersi (nom. inval.)]